LAGLAVVVGVSIVLFSFRPESSRITEARHDLIKAGMTEAEIETILGPVGDGTTRLVKFGPTDHMDFLTEHDPGSTYLTVWADNDGRIEVDFDRDGKAVLKQFWHPEPVNPDLIETVRWRAKRLRRK
jgi:hypothetical protein